MGFSALLGKLGMFKSKEGNFQHIPTLQDKRQHDDAERDQRRKRRQSILRPKTSDGAADHRRTSFFGQPVTRGEEVPELPKSMHLRNALGEEIVRPVTANSTAQDSSLDAVKERRKSRRLSIGRALSRKRSEPALSSSQMSSRPDQYQFEALPPMPTMLQREPAKPQASAQPPQTSLAEKRLSRKLSQKNFAPARKASFSKRLSRSIWTSSNPDNNDQPLPPRDSDNVPPIPALVRSNTTSPNSSEEHERLEAWRNNSNASDTPMAKVPPPLTMARKTGTGGAGAFRPKSAGRAFLNTTSQASDAQRTLFRKSMGISDNKSMTCFSEQQAREWEKLKALIHAVDSERQQQEEEDGEGRGNGRSSFANNEALAALEFNVNAR